MLRESRTARAGWREALERLGLSWHTADGVPYWDETACYVFTPAEIDQLEAVTAELQARCLEAVQHVIDRNRFAELRIPPHAAELVRQSWEEEPPAIYGRFDLAWNGNGAPKLLEYNADTPTALLEAAVAQWEWLEQVAPASDQWNSIHERLVAGWKDLAPHIPGGLVHFASVETPEDLATVTYLQDTAEQGGLQTRFLPMASIGWHAGRQRFVDEQGDAILCCFKLYPWEWMVREQFAPQLREAQRTLWMEPAWKMVLSNKGILPVLWELFPGHPNLLEAHFQHGKLRSYAQKPLLSREGANVRLVLDGVQLAAGPDDGYGAEGFIEQALTPEPVAFDGGTPRDGASGSAARWPVLGAWVIQGEPAGMGVREGDGMITTNTSRFVPHRIDEAGKLLRGSSAVRWRNL